MVLSGTIWILFLALHLWLIAVSIYAWSAAKYRIPVQLFWSCQIAVMAAQILIPSANYITPIPWMLIYLAGAFMYMWLHHVDREINLLKLGLSMAFMAMYCMFYYVLAMRHERYGNLNYVLTIGLNVFTIWQGMLLYGGAKKIIKQNGG